MALILIGEDTQIEASDHVLDQICRMLEDPPTAGGGFWVAGQLIVERNGEQVHPDPLEGHQRLWVSSSQLVTLIYDRPLHPNPDVIADNPTTVLL